MPRARVLVVDDEEMIRWSIEQTLRGAEYEVITAGSARDGLARFREFLPQVVFLDVRLPDGDGLSVLKRMKADGGDDSAVVIMTAFAEIQTAVEAMRLGAYDYLKKPFEFEELEVIVKRALETTSLRRDAGQLRQERQRAYAWDNIVGRSKKMAAVLELLDKVASSNATTVLIQGENGTGKDLVARALHYRSARAEGPFMDIATTAMPENLLESELFGYEKGAFTGAGSMKRGLLELANGGTLFLDEIGDMPLLSQAKLLKVLESRRFKRVGGTVDHEIDVRIVAATNRPLEQAVRDGVFREDLYYRLNVVPVVLPPLRERQEDVPTLFEHYMEKYNKEFRKHFCGISDAAMALLTTYSWPGNVRELRNLVERILILENDDLILPRHLPPGIREPRSHAAAARFPLPCGGLSLEEVEKDFVCQALEATGGNQTRAARLLGISRDALRYRIQKFDLASP